MAKSKEFVAVNILTGEVYGAGGWPTAPYFNQIYRPVPDDAPQTEEPGKTPVMQQGYRTTEEMVNEFRRAGTFLEEYRKARWDAPPGADSLTEEQEEVLFKLDELRRPGIELTEVHQLELRVQALMRQAREKDKQDEERKKQAAAAQALVDAQDLAAYRAARKAALPPKAADSVISDALTDGPTDGAP